MCGFTHRQTAPLHACVCAGVCVCAHNSKPSERSCHHDPNLTVSFSPPQHSSRLRGLECHFFFFSLSPLLPSPMFTGCECRVSRRSRTVITHDALFKRHVRMKSNGRACVCLKKKKKRLAGDRLKALRRNRCACVETVYATLTRKDGEKRSDNRRIKQVSVVTESPKTAVSDFNVVVLSVTKPVLHIRCLNKRRRAE